MKLSETVRSAAAAALLCAPWLVVACAGKTSESGTNQACVPGSTQMCVGPGACLGGQACRSDGQGYEPCNCGGAGDGGVADAGGGSGSSGGSSSGPSTGSSSGPSSGSSGGGTGPWDCLGNPNQSFPAGLMTTVTLVSADSLQPILTAQAADGGSGLDFVQYTPIAGLPVRACPTLSDPSCADGTPWQTSSDAGLATFTLLNGFGGYFEFGPDAGLFTTSYYPGQMVAGQTTATVAASLLPESAVIGLEALLPGVHIDHDTDGGIGHLLLTVFDCQDHSAPGVSFAPSQIVSGGTYPTQIFYTVGTGGQASEIPSTSATSTDNSGTGGILNLPSGEIEVTATLKSTGQSIGSLNILVPPGVAAAAVLRVRTH